MRIWKEKETVSPITIMLRVEERKWFDQKYRGNKRRNKDRGREREREGKSNVFFWSKSCKL